MPTSTTLLALATPIRLTEEEFGQLVEFVRNGLLDQSAILLARDHHLPIHVFDFDAPGIMLKICQGEDLGTRIGEENDL